MFGRFLTLAGDRIKEITAFRAPAAFASFDLPETLDGEPKRRVRRRR